MSTLLIDRISTSNPILNGLRMTNDDFSKTILIQISYSNLLTKSAASEYGHKGIRINAVSPGVIRTPGVEKYFEEQPKIAEGLKQAAVMRRLGEPSEIAEAVTFLASDRASFITGQLLSVDGGASVK